MAIGAAVAVAVETVSAATAPIIHPRGGFRGGSGTVASKGHRARDGGLRKIELVDAAGGGSFLPHRLKPEEGGGGERVVARTDRRSGESIREGGDGGRRCWK